MIDPVILSFKLSGITPDQPSLFPTETRAMIVVAIGQLSAENRTPKGKGKEQEKEKREDEGEIKEKKTRRTGNKKTMSSKVTE